MATRITKADAERVHTALVAMLGKDFGGDAPWSFTTRDNWTAKVSGWRHPQGWSRGFCISDRLAGARRSRGHVPSKHDGGRYEGVGWHQRMAVDIVDALAGLRGRQVG